MVLVEAVAAALVASILGIVLAWGVANGVLTLLDSMEVMTVLPDRTGLTPGMIVLPVVAGVIVATAAAWGPARTAARIEPLQALRTAQGPGHVGTRPDPIRAGISILLMAGGGIFLLGGIAMSYGGSIMAGIMVGMVGGLGTFLGVLVGASILVPAINRLVTRVTARLPSIPARIAAANGVRNPRRSTATAIALEIGVALVSMMVVGAETLKATLADEVDTRVPWDLQVEFDTSPDQATASAYVSDLARIEGVDAYVPTDGFDVTTAGPDSITTPARAVDPAELAAVWRDADAIAGFGEGVALIPTWLANELGLVDGDMISLGIADDTVAFEVIEVPGWDGILLPEAVVAATGVAAEPRGVILRLDDEADPEAMLDEAYAVAETHGLIVHGSGLGGYRDTLEQALDTLLYIVTALLAVAVLIAIVGVSNTLSLSVIERTGESALLRALGYTRRQLGQTLVLEGVLLAAIGTVIGLVLGTIYGWVGAFTVIGDTWSVSLGFPVGRIAVIVVAAVACGLLASVLPARRAANVDPVVALADV